MIRVLTVIFGFATGLAAAEVTEAERIFIAKIKPMFVEKCFSCHSDDAEMLKGEFNMQTRQQLLAGGENFGREVITPGDASTSFIMRALRWEYADFEMPPKEKDRFTAEQIEMIAEWINAGAPWSD